MFNSGFSEQLVTSGSRVYQLIADRLYANASNFSYSFPNSAMAPGMSVPNRLSDIGLLNLVHRM